jgi:hypothetical protein
MARIAGKKDQLTMVREVLRKAMTADELRAAQGVVLPLELGLSIAHTAIAIGRSVGVTCTMRTRYSGLLARKLCRLSANGNCATGLVSRWKKKARCSMKYWNKRRKAAW